MNLPLGVFLNLILMLFRIKNIFFKTSKEFWEKCGDRLIWQKKDVLRSTNKLPKKIRKWRQQKSVVNGKAHYLRKNKTGETYCIRATLDIIWRRKHLDDVDLHLIGHFNKVYQHKVSDMGQENRKRELR